jgi:hypothetical protein
VPGGRRRRLVRPCAYFHEWAGAHRFDQLIDRTLARYAVGDDDVPERLRQVRRAMKMMDRWSRGVGSIEEARPLLIAAGFNRVDGWIDAPADCVMTVDGFLRYKLAWVDRETELEAMGEEGESECRGALRSAFEGLADAAGLLHYDPEFLRIRAVAAPGETDRHPWKQV